MAARALAVLDRGRAARANNAGAPQSGLSAAEATGLVRSGKGDATGPADRPALQDAAAARGAGR